LALRRLFQRKTDYLTFRAVMEQPIPDIRRYRPELPDGVAEALSRALERDPGARFETARQFGTAILDGMQGVRPWSQGEISDFVATNFADEIGKRSQQVASVVHRTQAGTSSRATMPLLIHPDEAMHEDDDDEDFPSVETEVEGAAPWVPRPTPRPMNATTPGSSADFQTGGTPPPFGIESTGSAPMLQPLQRPGSPVMPPGPNTQPVVVMPRRSVFWPIFGVAMVLIAGGALFLVWQQMQNQQQQPSEIKITQEPAIKTVDDPDKVASVPMNETPDAAVEVEPGPGSAAIEKKKDPPKPKTFEQQLTAAIGARLPDLRGCLNQHPEGLPPKGKIITASVSIASSGRTKSVSLSPSDVDASTLGGCLKNVIKATGFPKGRDTSFQIPLSPKNG
jgi:hypothetical protein